MALNCFTYFGMKSFDEVDYMLLSEYEMLGKAHSLNKLEKERDMHWQAYLNMVVQSTEDRGKKSYPKYPTFDKFFNYEKQKERLFGVKKDKKVDKYKKLNDLILIANRKGG